MHINLSVLQLPAVEKDFFTLDLTSKIQHAIRTSNSFKSMTYAELEIAN